MEEQHEQHDSEFEDTAKAVYIMNDSAGRYESGGFHD
jgi:hypothetical protein